jgi:acyl-CoA synthetase (AMP-forming)/AMP-acid ligase II
MTASTNRCPPVTVTVSKKSQASRAPAWERRKLAQVVEVRSGAGSIPALAVRRFCAARLAPYKIPRAIVFVGTIPTTARGKVDRAAIEDLVRGQLSV